jgi:hypothetical protein
VNVDEARAEYLAARETASAALKASLERPRARHARATRMALAAGTDLTPEEVAAWVYATTDAVALYHDIMSGPTADLDKALAEEKEAK